MTDLEVRELSFDEIDAVSGGVNPLVIAGGIWVFDEITGGWISAFIDGAIDGLACGLGIDEACRDYSDGYQNDGN